MKWLELLVGPFVELVKALSLAKTQEERMEASMAFQRKTSDEIMKHELGLDGDQ